MSDNLLEIMDTRDTRETYSFKGQVILYVRARVKMSVLKGQVSLPSLPSIILFAYSLF